MAERQQLRGGTTLAVAMGVMNVTTYLYTILAARLLGPRDYGAFAALMGLLLVIMVASLALQATAARRIVATPGNVHQIEQLILKVGVQASIGLGVLCLVLSPVINQVVRLDSLGTAALVAFAAAPLTMMGAQAGILQGERRWIALAMIYIGAGRAPARHRHGPDRVVADRVRRAARRGHRGVRPGGWWAGSPSGAPRDPGGALRGAPGRRRCGARRSTTPTRCSRSSPSPTSTSWSRATCSTSTRRACTPAA